MMKRTYCILAAVILMTAAICVAAQDDTRPSATWEVQKYDINATLPQSDSDRNLSARAKLDLKNISARPALTLTLRISSSAEITAASINSSTVEFTKAEEMVN